MARFGTNIQAGLGRIDYTPYAQGAIAGSQAIGRGIESIGEAFKEYGKRKEERELYQSTVEGQIGRLAQIQAEFEANRKKFPELKSPLEGIDINQYKNLSDFSTSKLKATSGELAALIGRAEKAPERALQAAQLESVQLALAQQKQDIENAKAMTTAFAGIPQTKKATVKVPELEVTSKPPAFKGLDEFMYAGGTKETPNEGFNVVSKKPQSPSNTVLNQAPAGTGLFLGQNYLTGQYQYLGDRAAKIIAQEEQASQQAMPRIEEIKKIVKDGYVSVTRPPMASGRQGIPTPQTERIPLSEEQKLALQNEQFALEQQVNQRISQVNQLKQRASAAEKFSGQPLTKEAGDPVIERAANALARFDNRVDVLKREVTANIVDREKTLDVPLTPNERMQEFMTRYIEKGGQVNTKMIGEIKRAVGADMEHFKFGDVQGVRIGDNVKLFDSERKPLSVASMRYADERMYEQLVSVAAKAGIDRLSPEDREILAQLNNKYGPEDVDILTNTRRKRLLADVVNERAINLGLASRPAAIVPTPATPSKTGAAKYTVEVEKPKK
jgi:hypothetical protein